MSVQQQVSRSGECIASLLERYAHGERTGLGIGPVATGFHPLDELLGGGLLPHELVLLGGQPAVGKTLTALQWARHMAEERSVIFACFEHDEGALLGRLLTQEVTQNRPDLDVSAQVHARQAIRQLTLGIRGVDELIDSTPIVRDALNSLYAGAPGLRLIRASGIHSSISAFSQIAAEHLDAGGVLFIDYLQKVPVHSATSLAERVYMATEGLKEIATSQDITVVALASADASGIGQNRLRMEHLRGSDALAHEADVAMILNEKWRATSPRHVDFDITQLEAARRKIVLSVEKNRRGESGLHLEFEKDFENFRLVPGGDFVKEALVDD